MKPLNTARILKIRPRTIFATASLLAGLLVSVAAGAVPAETIMEAPKPAGTTVAPQPNAATAPTPHDAWKSEILRSPAPKQGCFKTTEPSTQWQEVPCKTAPNKPYPPSSGPRPDTVGNGSDFSAQVTGTITSAVGSFDSVTGVVEESDGATANTFSLQLNTNTFSSPACSTAKTPASCAGWEQFVYSNSGIIFTQYWLLNYVNKCPSGWNTYQSHCWRNASNATSVPVQNITNLKELSVTGKASQNGQDIAIMTVGSTAYTESNPDSALNLAAGWKLAEFNVFGDCCSSQANFNAGSTVVVRTEVSSGTTNAPACSGSGFTGETNNLIISSPCTVVGGAAPAIVFTESLAANPTSCYVFNDGYTNMAGPSDAVFINSSGQACIPNGQANGTCRKWFGRCTTNSTHVAVNLNVFNDGYTNMAGPSDAVFINSSGQACIPNGQANGTCRRWFGRGTTADGSDATCTVFGNGYTNQSVPADAVFINGSKQACIPNGQASGTCQKWWGRCQAH